MLKSDIVNETIALNIQDKIYPFKQYISGIDEINLDILKKLAKFRLERLLFILIITF